MQGIYLCQSGANSPKLIHYKKRGSTINYNPKKTVMINLHPQYRVLVFFVLFGLSLTIYIENIQNVWEISHLISFRRSRSNKNETIIRQLMQNFCFWYKKIEPYHENIFPLCISCLLTCFSFNWSFLGW